MADIVNGGAIILVAAFGLAAIVGAADEFRQIAGPASSRTQPDAVSGRQGDEPSEASDVEAPGVGNWKDRLGDDRDDKRGDGERGRDRDDERRHDGERDGDEEDDD